MNRFRLLAVLFLLLGLANGVRAALAFRVQSTLRPETLSLPLPLLGGLYGFFALGFLGVTFFLWTGRTARIGRLFAVTYQLTLWTIRLLGYHSPYHQALWARDLVFTALFLTAVWILTKSDRRDS
ncbi:MAG: hypothetical protein ACP5HM_05940 [Anaerolineae bacterium]